MFIRPWLEALKSRWMPAKRRTSKRLNPKPVLPSHVESLEEKVVLSAFDLVTVIPNQGVFLTNNTTLSEAPRELTLRFSPGQDITAASAQAAITVTRAGLDGIFDDPSTPAVESSDDQAVALGYVGVGDNPNEVIVRFASTLPDDKYQVRIQSTGSNAIVGDPGDTLTPDAGKTYKSFNFELDLGAQVEAVVPQPVIRDQIFSATQFSSLTDGDIVSINAGPYSYRFEINLTGSASNGLPVDIASGATPTQIADALVTAINASATGILTASNNGNVITVAGSSFEPVVTFTTTKIDAFAKSNVTILGTGTQFADGDLFRVTLTNPTTSINTVYTFELNKLPNNSVGGGNIRVDFSTGDDASTIAGKIATAINNLSINTPTAKLSAIAAGSSIALAASSTLGTPAVTVVTATPNLVTQPAGALSHKTDQVVVYFNQDELDTAIAEDPTYYRLLDTATAVLNVSNYAALTEATTLSVALGATTLTFEFDTNGSVSGSNIQVDLTSLSTAAQVAGFIAAQINNVVVNPAQVIQATVNGEVVAITGGTSGKPTITSTTNPGALTQTTKVLLPDTVDYFYNPANGLSAAVLKFGTALPNTSYNIKIGSSTERSGTDSANPINAGAIYSNQDFIANDWIGDGVGSSVNSSATDVDLYQFSTTAAGIYTFTLNSSSTLDGVITFYNASAPNTPIATINSNGLGGTESFTTGMLGNNQTFYVKVSGNAGTGSYTLTLEANSGLVSDDNNSSFDPITGVPNSGATDLGNLGTSGITVTGHAIEAQSLYVIMPQLPGGSDEPGHRDLPLGPFPMSSEPGHSTGTTADPAPPNPTAEWTYSFPLTYGSGLNNQITPEQRAMARQILQIYANYSGIQFREVAAGAASNLKIITGDPRAIDPTIDPLAVGGIAGGDTAIINAAGAQGSDGTYGGGWFGTAVHEIGHVLGLGHSYDIPSIQGNGLTGDAVFPGDNDIVHLLRLYPDNSSDIDLYKFTINQSGTLSAQTIAERLGGGNLLDTVLTLYKEDANGVRTVVARNDDFYSKDSGLQIALSSQSYPATYYIGVTSTGNDNYDPSIANSGNGGTSRGNYDLKLNFEPAVSASSNIADATGRSLDGDHDGKVGGEYSGWFVVAPTVFVDKLAPAAGADGTTAHPYQTIGGALTAGVPAGSILRIVGNGGADGDASTVADNAPYVIGNDYVTNAALPDGSTFQVPKDVTVMIDAGALIKVRGQTIDVGTSSQGTDRSHGSLQVLGTPVTNVTFTSWRDDSKGSLDDGTNGAAAGADWGGIVFRQDSDSAVDGTFVNLVNHATLQYGGGQVSVDGGQLRVYNVIDLETSRPTISNNTIKNNADAAISANPDSFKADDGRIGPDIHGNTVTQNSTNGLFIRIQTSLGSAAEQLNVIARFDDTDITHVITQNLILNGHPAGDLSGTVSARLMIDPGTIIKLSGARIETGLGSSNLIAEGTAENPIRFTSQQDDKYGIGGTFDLKNDQNTTPLAGNWSGIFLQPTSTASFDHVSITYAGGASEVAGNTDNFNAIESLQANLRVANSVFENNAGGAATTGRGGRGGNEAAAIFVRGAQPIIVDNVFRNNVGYVVSINANSLQDSIQPDSGRSTGALDRFSAFDDNYGPLVRLNTYEGNGTNGMHVRAEELTIESVWDDTDIAHVVTGTISSSEFHTYGGLRLQSSTSGSLVVKLQGATAGFAATGDPLEIDDRIGGTVQIIGQPGFPVVLTSLKDDTVSAGFLPNGFPSFDTNGDGASTPQAGDWNSVSFDQNSNDRNVAIVNETEPAQTHGNDSNATVGNPQSLGNLAPNVNSGDENRRLGFEVHGFISADSPSDMDVYSFTANAGTEVWIDLDFTSDRLDAMVELVSSNGQTVLARSLNSIDEQNGVYPLSGTLYNTVGGVASTTGSDLNTLTKDPNLGGDFYTKNFHDAGFRVVLPGTTGALNTYFVRVRSQPATNPTVIPGPADPAYKSLTSGAYQLQVRLRQQDEQPGSTVRYADIRYATNGIELHGLPAHSPLTGEAAEVGVNNDSTGGAQNVGPLLQTDRNTISVSGSLSTDFDVDFFKFTVDYSQIQVIAGSSDGGKYFPLVLDIDWADGLTRPDTSIAVYDEFGKLIYVGRGSDLADDQPAPGQGQDVDDLTRGSVGGRDPFIGPILLPAGVAGDGPASGLTTYYVAVYSNGKTPTALSANFNSGATAANQLVRLEPVNSIRRIVEDHIGFTGYTSQKSLVSPVNGPLFDLGNTISLATNIRAFTLADVNLFVTTSSGLYVFDPYYGRMEVDYTDYGAAGVQDLNMRSDGRLFGVRDNTAAGGANEGFLVELDTATGAQISSAPDGIAAVNSSASPLLEQQNDGNILTALAIYRGDGAAPTYDLMYYAAPDSDLVDSDGVLGGPLNTGASKLYRANGAGSAAFVKNSTGAVGLLTDGALIDSQTTGMQFSGSTLYGVSADGQFFEIDFPLVSPGSDNGNGILPSVVSNITDFEGDAALGGGKFAGLTTAPQNLAGGDYAHLLFAITTTGRIVAIDPGAGGPGDAKLVQIFDNDNNRTTGVDEITGAPGSESSFLQLKSANGGSLILPASATGLAFSPVDFNLWHPTEQKGGEAGHGVNSTSDGSLIDNSRTPGLEYRYSQGAQFSYTENVGAASMYYGLEEYGSTIYYGSKSQFGVSEQAQQDLTSGALGGTYNTPGGSAGSLVTNAFSLEGYAAGDEPTLYFNYWLDTADDAGDRRFVFNEMTDSARVYVSTDNGQSWTMVATNNSNLSDPLLTSANNELPTFLSTSSNASGRPNQVVQELFDTDSWRQARIDLRQFVGSSTVKLRFDFSTSGRTGTAIDPATGLRVSSNDVSNPTYQAVAGDNQGLSAGGSSAAGRGADNDHVGFFIDDIIVGFAGRGEMVTNAPVDTSFVNLATLGNGLDRRTLDTTATATPELLQGDYQLSIRRGEDYAVIPDTAKPDVLVAPTLSINDRLTEGYSIRVGNLVQDGDYVTISDGIETKVFEFDTDNNVTTGRIQVNVTGLNTTTAKGSIAAALATQITSAFSGRASIIAKAVGASSNSDQVDLFGAVYAETFTVPVAPPVIPAQTESNDTLATATNTTITNASKGTYTGTGTLGDGANTTKDVDLFSMQLAAGQNVQIDLDLPTGSGYSILRVFSSTGLQLATASFNAGPSPEYSFFESYISFTAGAAGTYYIGVSAYANYTYDPTVAGSGVDPFDSNPFTYNLNIFTGTAVRLSTDEYRRRGDDNLPRQQGQIIIENNSILHSLTSGILVDDSQIGASANTPVTTAENLVTGLYIQNNVVAGFGQSGIDINGQTNAAIITEGEAATPFVKVVNNTIVNTGNIGVGIRATNNVSPTLMNNAIVGTATAILIDASSTSTEVEANLFQNNTSTGTTGNNSLVVANGVRLFVDAAKDNYYPAPGSALIDSSRSNFNDRATYSSVVGALSIPPSPIIAPLFDRYGQLRVDDGSQAGPPNQPGLGQNPFQDRGALERADFDGGLVVPVVPLDNDASGVDLDPSTTSVWIDAATPGAEFSIFTTFTLQLIDSGIGIDDSTVSASDFLLLQNGSPLVEGQDYFFTYNQNTNEAIFTSVSTFALDSRYQIILDAAGIQDLAANNLQNNQAQPISPNANVPAPFDSSLLYFTYVLTDGKNDVPTVAVGGVNAPLPTPVQVNEDTSLTFSSTITAQHLVNNAITVFDQDAFLAADGDPNTGTDGGRISVTITVAPSYVGNPNLADTTVYGTLSLVDASVTDALVLHGGSFTFSGTQYVLEGRIDDIKAALEGLTFTPIADFPSDAPTTVQLIVDMDDSGKFGPATPVTTPPTYIIPIQVLPVNDAPTLTVDTPPAVTTSPGNVTIEEDAGPTQLTLTNITAGGGENQTLTVTVTSSNTSIIPNPSFTYTSPNSSLNVFFTPAANQFTAPGQPVTLTITVNDGVTTTSKTVKVTVTSVNDAPTLGPISSPPAIDEDDPAHATETIFLTGISAGAANENQSLTFSASIISGPIIVNNFVITQTSPTTATLTYKPIANANGTAVVKVTVTDSNGASNTPDRTFTVQINPVNDPPTIDQIPDRPLLEDAGPQTFDLTNIFPGPFGETGSVTSIDVTSNNPTVVPNANIAKGTFNSGAGTLQLIITPVANVSGPVTISVVVTDEGGRQTTMSFKMDVTAVNDVPVLGPITSPNPIAEGAGQQTINLSGISAGPPDEIGQTLTITATYVSGTPNLVNNFQSSAVNGSGNATLSYTPLPDAFGTAVYSVVVNDGFANSAPQLFTVTINPVNDDPTMNSIINPAPILEDAGQRSITLTGLSGGPANEDQTLTFSAAVISGEAIVDSFEFAPVPGQPSQVTLKYKTVQDFNGTSTIEVTATDSQGAFVKRTFAVTITPVNDRPTLDAIANQSSVTEDSGEHTINLTGISVGPVHEQTETPLQNLVFTVTSDNPALIPNLSSNLRIEYTSGSTGQLVYKALDNAYGTAKITVNVTDTGSPAGTLLTPIEFTVTVTPLPDAPTDISLSNNIVLEQKPAGTLVGTLSTTDADLPSDTSTYTIVGGTGVGFFNIPAGTNQLKTSQPLVYADSPGGVYTVIVRTQDSDGLFFEKTFTIENSPNSNPTDIQLSNNQIAEIPAGATLPANVLVGTLTTSDPEVIDTHTYTLVGGADVASFKIVGNQLIAVGPLDYDTHANGEFTVVIRSTDSHSPAGFLDKTFTIRTTNVNEPATGISIGPNPTTGVPNSVPENQPANTIVGALVAADPDVGDTAVSFTLVSGAGSTDNLLFKIVGGNLVTNGTFNFEAKSTYTVRIRTTDAGGLSFETPVVISITNVNEVATNINLSGSTVVENSPAGTVIGNFTTVDPDVADTFTYTLVPGAGGTDNAKFEIANGVLRVVTPPNYEDPGHAYSIRVRSTDSGNPELSVEKTFSITITNVNESPTGLVLSNTTVAENKPVGTVVGLFGTDDPDFPEGFTYSLVAGAGADDNNLFAIAGDKLVTATTFDFEAGPTTYSVRVQTRDTAGLTFEKIFTITITDAFDAPVITLAGSHATTTGRKAVVVDSSAQITDIDTTDFNGGKLVVKIQAGEQIGDTLSIAKGASFGGLKLKTVKGKTVLKLGKTEIGTVSGGVRAIPLTIQFTSSISTDLMQTIMRSIAFKGKPFAAPRVVSMQVFDDKGLGSNIATRNIDVT